MKKNIKYLIIFFTLINVISCNGQDKKEAKQTTNIQSQKSKTSIPNFLDKKYFKKYQLSAENDYPQYFYFDNKIGEITIDFFGKNRKLQKEWLNYDSANNIIIEAEVTNEQEQQINLLIKKKLEPNLKDYNIIAEYVLPKYIMKNSHDYIYPYKRLYYLYDKEKKSWNFLKEKTIADGVDEKNITKLEELNAMLNISENISLTPLSSIMNDIKKQGFEISFEKSGDINQDGNFDKVLVLRKEASEFPKPFLVYVLLLDNKSNLIKIFKNENILSPINGNSTAEGLRDIPIKNGYFTFEDNILAGNPTENTYTTFQYNKDTQEIFLHKYGISTMYNDSSKDWDKEYSPKNFGLIKFEEFNLESINSKLK